jgi:hypothetical protein
MKMNKSDKEFRNCSGYELLAFDILELFYIIENGVASPAWCVGHVDPVGEPS